MTGNAIITLEMLDWWLAGTGASQTGGADRNGFRDEWGCPAIPASQIKGTLRETAALWAGWNADKIALWFGTAEEEGHLVPGAMAMFPLDHRQWFAANPQARAQLWDRIPSTAINPATGAADHGTLRLTEAAVPMTLELPIAWDGVDDPPPDWIAQLDMLCALTPAFGAGKQDGFGRVIAKCAQVAA